MANAKQPAMPKTPDKKKNAGAATAAPKKSAAAIATPKKPGATIAAPKKPGARKPAARKPAANYRHARVISVSLWGEEIGRVIEDPATGYFVFRYAPGFADTGIEPAPLQMPASQDAPFSFTDLPAATYRRLPAMLADALPDDFGNALINRYMADRGISPAAVTALDRLAYMGARSMGALTFKPSLGPREKQPTPLDMAGLVIAARGAVRGEFAGDDETHAALRDIIDVGTSAGGARAKAVIAWNEATREIKSGQFDAPPGFGHWLLKFDGMGGDERLGTPLDYGRIEYAYHLMARAAGIAMTECRLLEENGRAHFMTRRFDREGAGTRHHVQTLCAMAHLDYKRKAANSYSQLFSAAAALALDYEDMEEIFRRMVFNVMGRNCDDHTKNFSFRLRQGRRWELAPAYDITYSHNPTGEWTYQHLMSVNGKFKDFTADDMLAEARRFAVGTAPKVIGQVRAAIGRWEEFGRQAGMPKKEIERIGADLLTLK